MFKYLFVFIFSALFTLSAFAADLHSARDQGKVGETKEGYVKAIGTASADTAKIVEEVNAKRKKHYHEMAAKNKQSIESIQKMFSVKIQGKLNTGNLYQDAAGEWKKK